MPSAGLVHNEMVEYMTKGGCDMSFSISHYYECYPSIIHFMSSLRMSEYRLQRIAGVLFLVIQGSSAASTDATSSVDL